MNDGYGRVPGPGSRVPDPLLEVTGLFARLGVTAFGGPAAHVALMERECVRERRWLTHDHFLALLSVANLIPGPTSTELAMHIGRMRAGWPGLVMAGVAFITPAALVVGVLAAVYVRAGDLHVLQGVLEAVRPVVLVVVLDAWLRLSRAAIRSVPAAAVAVASVVGVWLGVPEIAVLLLGGVGHLLARRRSAAAALFSIAAVAGLGAQSVLPVRSTEVFAYFAGVGSLLFGSGYVLLSLLEADLVAGRGWLTKAQLIDAIAVGQSTPGPVFTTATFVGYLLGGPWMAAVATVAIFLPSFVLSAASAVGFDRIRRSTLAQQFLAGVNASAVALIVMVLFNLAATALTGVLPWVVAALSAVLVFGARLHPTAVLLGAAGLGAAASFF